MTEIILIGTQVNDSSLIPHHLIYEQKRIIEKIEFYGNF